MSVKIRYENTIDDFVALARYHSDHSPAARRVRVRAMWGLTVAVLMVVIGVALKMSDETGGRGPGWQERTAVTVTILLTALLIGLVGMPGGFRRQAERQTRRLYAEGSNRSVLGTRELEIVGNDLISRSPHGESRLRLEVLERVVTHEGYTFIYVNALTAHVIPHGAVSEGDPDSFADAISGRFDHRCESNVF